MASASLFSFGSVSLLRADRTTVRGTTQLIQPSFSFGRLSSSDCRILLDSVSKKHAIISVDPVAPYTAVLEVHGINGVSHNGVQYEKGCIIPLDDNDEFVICERMFRWSPATTCEISVDSPPASQRRPLRYSLISAAQAVTPSKSSASSSIFGGLLSPFRTAPAPVEAELAQPESDDEVDELMSWDEQPEEGVDGIGADLISWDEQDVAATEEAAENELPVDASVAAGTPSSAKGQFTMASTPALSQRARSLREPTSATRLPTTSTPITRTSQSRRRSLRMTIVPADRAIDWVQERAERMAMLEASSPVRSAPTTPTKSSEPSTTSTPRVASGTSSTSRRISALLLSPASFAGSHDAMSSSFDESDSSDDEDEDEEDEEEDEEVELVAQQCGEEHDQQVLSQQDHDVALVAAAVPLPESPFNSPTAAPAPVAVTPSIPRYSARRHSLREKVLIRSAIKKATTPPLSPTEPTHEPSREDVPVAPEETDVIMVDDFIQETSEEDSEPIPVAIETPLKTPRSPRDSIDLLRAAQIATSVVHGPAVDDNGDAEEEATSEPALDATPTRPGTATPDPVSPTPRTPTSTIKALEKLSLVPARTPRSIPLPDTPAGESSYELQTVGDAQHVARTPRSVPLPETPLGERSYTPPSAPVAAPRTPEPSLFSFAMLKGTPTEPREAFLSEMTSPVTHHRLMATPKSVLRTARARSKSARGFLQPPLSTIRRKVVFNEEVYVQEVVDIRDKRMHWTAADSPEQQPSAAIDPASVPLPASPFPTPQRFTSPAAPTSTARRAQRVPTHVNAATFAASLARPSPRRLATPVRLSDLVSPSKTPMATPSSAGKRRAERVAVPYSLVSTPKPLDTSVRKAGRVAVSHDLSASTVAKRQQDIQALLATPVAPAVAAVIPKSAAPSKTASLLDRMEAIRRRSLPATEREPLPTSSAVSVPRMAESSSEPQQLAVEPSVEEALAPATEEQEDPSAVEPSDTGDSTIDDLQLAEEFGTPDRRGSTPLEVAPTPNLTAGLRRLFGTSNAAQATPKFGGLRSLFHVPSSPAGSPQLDGVAELLSTPAPVALAPAPSTPVPSTPIAGTTSPNEPSAGLTSEDLGAGGVGIEADILAASALRVSYVDRTPESSPSRSNEDASSQVDVDGAPTPALETPDAVAEEVTEEVVSEEMGENEAIKPKRGGRKTTSKSAEAPVPTRSRSTRAASVVVEEEATITPAPTRRGRTKATADPVSEPAAPGPRRGRAKKTEVEKVEPEQPEQEIGESASEPAATKKAPARKGRAAKAPIVVHEDVAEEEEPETTSDSAPVRATRGKRVLKPAATEDDTSAPALPKAKAVRGKAATATVVEEHDVENVPVKPKRATRKAAAVVETAEAPIATRALRARR